MQRLKKDKEIIFIVACQVSNIDKVIVKTNKGIQTAQYSESAKPLISIASPKKDNIFEAKFETKPLNELYQVSIYTCYQDKDEVGEVAEYCTPLLVNERKDFDLPLSLFYASVQLSYQSSRICKKGEIY